MALKFDGVSPTEIKYSGTDLKILKYGDTSVWGKPYALSITVDDNVTVTVKRTDSYNEHANTGTLVDGNIVYHGDFIQITATPKTGYTLETLTVNGSNFTSGNITAVNSSITITAKSKAEPTWHTIYTGSSTATNTSTTSGNTLTTALSPSIIIPENAIRIRITGSYRSKSSPATSFTNRVITLSSSKYTTYSFTSYVQLIIQNNDATPLQATLVSSGSIMFRYSSITITKCEAYY